MLKPKDLKRISENVEKWRGARNALRHNIQMAEVISETGHPEDIIQSLLSLEMGSDQDVKLETDDDTDEEGCSGALFYLNV